MDYEIKLDKKGKEPLREVFSARLNFWMNMREKRQVDLANELGLSDQSVANWRKGKSMPSLDMIDKISAALNISPLSLLIDEDSGTAPSVRIPILGRVVAGNEREPLADKIGETEIPVDWAATGQYFALRVNGDSMAPKILDGDTVIVKMQSDVFNRDIAIVFVGEEATMKQVLKSKEGITLYGYNTDVYQPHMYTNEQIADLPVTILGRVVQIRRNV